MSRLLSSLINYNNTTKVKEDKMDELEITSVTCQANGSNVELAFNNNTFLYVASPEFWMACYETDDENAHLELDGNRIAVGGRTWNGSFRNLDGGSRVMFAMKEITDSEEKIIDGGIIEK